MEPPTIRQRPATWTAGCSGNHGRWAARRGCGAGLARLRRALPTLPRKRGGGPEHLRPTPPSHRDRRPRPRCRRRTTAATSTLRASRTLPPPPPAAKVGVGTTATSTLPASRTLPLPRLRGRVGVGATATSTLRGQQDICPLPRLRGRVGVGAAGAPISALGEHQPPALGVHAHRVAVAEAARQDLLRQRVLQLLLDRALERACAV